MIEDIVLFLHSRSTSDLRIMLLNPNCSHDHQLIREILQRRFESLNEQLSQVQTILQIIGPNSTFTQVTVSSSSTLEETPNTILIPPMESEKTLEMTSAIPEKLEVPQEPSTK